MSVCCGATVTESPVWTPIGSMFSIEQTITTLSLWSRMTSSSNSPQPMHRLVEQHLADRRGVEAARRRSRAYSSARAGDAAAAAAERERRADDRRQADARPARRVASSSVVAIALRGIRSPARSIVWRNRSRSSARPIAS